MEKRWGQNVAARGGFSGNSPDALLLNLFITGAAEKEDKALAQPQSRLGWGQIQRTRADSNAAGRQGGSDLPPEHQRP